MTGAHIYKILSVSLYELLMFYKYITFPLYKHIKEKKTRHNALSLTINNKKKLYKKSCRVITTKHDVSPLRDSAFLHLQIF